MLVLMMIPYGSCREFGLGHTVMRENGIDGASEGAKEVSGVCADVRSVHSGYGYPLTLWARVGQAYETLRMQVDSHADEGVVHNRVKSVWRTS